MIEEEGMDFDALRETIVRLLPILLIGTLIVVNMMVMATQVWPQWQAYVSAQADVDAAQTQLEALQNAEQDDSTILASQVEDATGVFNESVQPFLTPTQPEEILENLYFYADESAVTITGVLTQQSAVEIESNLYNVRMFRVHVLSTPTRLMNFVMRIQEARLPSVQIQNLAISENEDASDLTMDILLYNSAFADGTVLSELPYMDIPEAFDPPPPPDFQALIGAEQDLMAEEAGATTLVDDAGNRPDDVLGPVSYGMEETSETTTGVVEGDVCSAPATIFQIGQTVVVDFNDDGALNMLQEPRTHSGPIELIGIVRDNDQLRIISGPVCGQWDGSDVWYWLVDHNGLQGWVGEASRGDRWLCTMAEPECT